MRLTPLILWQSSFSKLLAPDIKNDIENFSLFFKDLNTQTKSTKIDILFSHVQAICLKNEPALGVYSEQAGKSIHAKFSESARHRLPKDFNHRSFKSKLLDVMVSHNAERI